MLDSLFKVKINWVVYFGGLFLFVLCLPALSLFSICAIAISWHQLLLLFYALNFVIPIRYIAGTLFCVQMLVGPVLAYNGINDIQYDRYKMQVPEAEYFIYAIPATICFIIGLHLFSGLRGEILSMEKIKKFIKHNAQLPYWLIGIGFLASWGTNLNLAGLGYLLYLIAGFKFIGAFMLISGAQRLNPLPVVVVFLSIILSSLGKAMFHDLVTWFIFLGAFVALRYKPAVWVKALLGVCFLLSVVIIQQVKGIYRASLSLAGQQGSVAAFDDALEMSSGTGQLFDKKMLAKSTVRINQGFIITYILQHVPARQPFSYGGEMLQILEAAFLPRIIAPDKLEAGDNSIVLKYAGIYLRQNTSMSLSALGDAYINFGVAGGCVFMLLLGGLFNGILILFNKYARYMPVLLLFMPLIFYYPIRPDTALQTSLGHLIKTSMVVAFGAYLFRNRISFFIKNKNIVPGQS